MKSIINAAITFYSLVIGVLWFDISTIQALRAEILEHPHTQYVLEGNNATYHCNTIGAKAYWIIDNETVSPPNADAETLEKYINRGFIFLPVSIDIDLGYYNLTMNVIASEETNNSQIHCRVRTLGLYEISENAHLIVFSTFTPGTFSAQAIDHTLVFYPNGTPLLTVAIQLPNDLWPNQEVNYTIMIENAATENLELIVMDGPYAHIGPGNVLYATKDGLKRDENYSLWVHLNSLAGSSASNRYYFDTILNISWFNPCKPIEATGTVVKLVIYKLALGMSLSLTVIIFLIIPLILLCIILHRKKRMCDKVTVSANNVCNAMVHNPIYDGPVYESVQRQFDTLTSTTLRAAQMSGSDPSLNQHCNSQLSTPTSSEKSVRYVEQPVQPPKPQSKSFVSNDHSHSSTSSCAAVNVPRSTNLSTSTVTKKAVKQRNKFNLTLTLNGNVPSDPVATQTCGPISAVNRAVLRDEEDNYMAMSPFDRGSKWNELSPEDTDQYKE